MENTYNGWTNWETWNFMLWYGDDLQMMIDDYMVDNEQDTEYGQIYHMVDGYIDNILEDYEQEPSFAGDLISHGFQKLNIWEITDSTLEEYKIKA